MSTPRQSSSAMPLFVPRTVAAFERAATQVARRVAMPVRALGSRAMSLADRVLGSWAAVTPGERPTMRAPQPGMPMTRPWYELDLEHQAEEEAAGLAAAAVRRAAGQTAAAMRGAQIERTALT